MGKRKFLTRKNRKRIIIGLFILFSTVLFTNNSNQFLSNWFNLSTFQINAIAWVGIILSGLYALFKSMDGKF